MQLDSLALNLRRRSPWEAIDLGCSMARAWWRPLLAAWCAAFVPIAVVLFALFRSSPMSAVLILWWLKPLFDRVVLEVLARAVFGHVPRVIAVLRALWGSPGLLASLTIHRFDAARSFTLPVRHLERLRGSAARARVHSLQRRVRSYAVWLTIVFLHFEVVMSLACYGAVDLFTPAQYDPAVGLRSILWNDVPLWLEWLGAGFAALRWALLEPVYVASGFALYLNRRTQLEAWDVELALRRLARRDTGGVRTAAAAAVLAASILACALPDAALAAAHEAANPQAAIEQVLAQPEFAQYRETTRLRFIGSDDDGDKTAAHPFDFVSDAAEIARVLMWLAAAALIVVLVYYGRRYVSRWSPERARRERSPAVLFGLDIAPESLPPDVADAALAAALDGRAREALGLLYRGALSALVSREGLDVAPGDTEGDCVRHAAARVNSAKADFFGAVVAAWQATAYAGQLPEPESLRSLCAAWRNHFGTGGAQ